MIFETYFSDEYQMKYGIVEGEATIIQYEGDDLRVIIPEKIDGYTVSGIEAYAFSGKAMRYIQFPDCLKRIDHHGFSECRQIQQLDFPEHLKVIGNYAFYNCLDLKSVHLTPFIKSIGFGAFKNCELLSEIIQDKLEDCEISIGSLLDDLNQQIHVTIRHLYADRPEEIAKVIFTEHDYEVVANVASMCKQFEATEIGSGKYIRYCIGSQDVDYYKYDGMFHVLLRGDTFATILTVAMERMMYPYALTGEARSVYHDYVREHIKDAVIYMIREDKKEMLDYLMTMDVLDEEALNEAMDAAISTGRTEYTSMLMDYKHAHFKIVDMSFDL